MRDRIALGPIFAAAALPAGCIALIAYFGFHAIGGPTGLMALQDYKTENRQLEIQAATIAATKASLQRQAVLLNPRHVDPDLGEELVRKNLNVIGKDEIIVPLDESAH